MAAPIGRVQSTKVPAGWSCSGPRRDCGAQRESQRHGNKVADVRSGQGDYLGAQTEAGTGNYDLPAVRKRNGLPEGLVVLNDEKVSRGERLYPDCAVPRDGVELGETGEQIDFEKPGRRCSERVHRRRAGDGREFLDGAGKSKRARVNVDRRGNIRPEKRDPLRTLLRLKEIFEPSELSSNVR